MEFLLSELAERLGATLVGDGSVRITGVSGIKEAGPGDLTFIADPRYMKHVSTTRAAAVIASENAHGCAKPMLIVPNAYLAFVEIVALFHPRDTAPQTGIHPTAIVGQQVALGKDVSLGPYVVVEDDAVIGDGSVILAGSFIGRKARLGTSCFLYTNVTIREGCTLGDRVTVHCGTVIGSDGFGYVRQPAGYKKVPQVGNVVVGDDVEIGSNVTIDRATFGATKVGRGTKIDNLVQIAHNVTIGENCIIVAQVGISGSVEVGDDATFGGQSGIVGHLRIGRGVQIGAQAGVTKSIPDGEVVSGYPAQPHIAAQRVYAASRKLPDLIKQVKALEEEVAMLRARIAKLSEEGSHE
jgi:UDP-3-O-[3-hydroxymyristoyl] glucosamine N-acyltransferase